MHIKEIRNNNQITCWFILLVTIMFLSVVLYFFKNPFYNEITIEAGTQLTINELLKDKTVDAAFVDKIDNEFLSTVGTHNIKVKNRYAQYNVLINVVDTIPPKAKISHKNMWIGDKISSDLFVSNIQDASPVTTFFLKQPDFNKEGMQNIIIGLKDISGNTTQYKTTLTLKKDTQAPIISTVNTIISNKGENISYKKNTQVTDNRDKEVTLNVDSTQVNYNKAGTYYAVYTAIDKAGNRATKKVKVIILNNSDADLKKEAQKLADQFINKVAKNKKTKQEKLKACYDYIRENIKYNGVHKGTIDNYYIDAVDGLKTWRGDCLVSNGVLRVICEQLDIPTMVVVRTSKRKTNHYWFLADTGDGWYHYDAFKRKNVVIYRWTDSQLLNWSKAHEHLADFDQSKYPPTPKK